MLTQNHAVVDRVRGSIHSVNLSRRTGADRAVWLGGTTGDEAQRDD